MTQAEALCKLLKLEPLEPLYAQHICGWPVDMFQAALSEAMQNGWVRLARGGNNHTTRLEAL